MLDVLSLSRIWHTKTSADLQCQLVRNLVVARHRLHSSASRIRPKRVRPPLTLQVATESAEVAEQRRALHLTRTVSRSASGGRPRNASSRRSSRINEIASAKLWRASSFVLPCPFAPGTSGQYAMNQSSSRSMIAVNSFPIGYLRTRNACQRSSKTSMVADRIRPVFVMPAGSTVVADRSNASTWVARSPAHGNRFDARAPSRLE